MLGWETRLWLDHSGPYLGLHICNSSISTWDYTSVTYLLVLTASIEPECENTGESLVWGLMAWEGEGRSMEHFHHEALDLTSSTQEVLL